MVNWFRGEEENGMVGDEGQKIPSILDTTQSSKPEREVPEHIINMITYHPKVTSVKLGRQSTLLRFT